MAWGERKPGFSNSVSSVMPTEHNNIKTQYHCSIPFCVGFAPSNHIITKIICVKEQLKTNCHIWGNAWALHGPDTAVFIIGIGIWHCVWWEIDKTDKTFCFGTKNDQVGQIKTIGHSDRLSMSCEVLLTSQHSLKWITYKFHQLRWPTVGILTGEKIC